jgi:hypothetical protein
MHQNYILAIPNLVVFIEIQSQALAKNIIRSSNIFILDRPQKQVTMGQEKMQSVSGY